MSTGEITALAMIAAARPKVRRIALYWALGAIDDKQPRHRRIELALEQVVRSRRSLSVGFRCAPACGGVMYFRRKTSAGRA
jgi:hypothetical protein